MSKVDFRKEFKDLYNPSAKQVSIVKVPDMNYLMIDGSGDPNKSKDYMDAIEALYAVSYTLKFMVKKGKTAVDYAVMPLEGLWWMEGDVQFSQEDRSKWRWTAMIMQPEYVTETLFNEAVEVTRKKKNPVALSKMRFELYRENTAAQIMHIGPYADETPTVDKLQIFIQEKGYKINGKHHEIYLGDPRKTAPEKLKTIIRYSIKK
jgi:hypothetical protein